MSAYRDYDPFEIPPEEDHDEPYRSELWRGVAVSGALLLAAIAIGVVLA